MIRFVVAVAFAAYSLMPLYGIAYWNWDSFQLLILYWTETAILAAWTMVRIALLPVDRLGDMTVNGKTVKATRRMMVGFFSLHAGGFIAVHLIFICGLFSGDHFSKLHGIGDFFDVFYVTSGAWLIVLVAIVVGGIDAVTAEPPPPKPAAKGAPAQRAAAAAPAYTFTSSSGGKETKTVVSGDAVGSIVGGLYGRILIMQLAIIGGAWAANSYGSLAPMVIIIALKTLLEFGSRLKPATN
jgi:hypothetical protein